MLVALINDRSWDVFDWMKLEKDKIANIEAALGGLADVFGVALVLIDANGNELSKWKHPCIPYSPDPFIRDLSTACVGNVEFDEHNASVIKDDSGRRRFVVPLSEIEELPILVLSDVLPKQFAWVDGSLEPQKVIGCEVLMEKDPKMLLGTIVANTCHVVANEWDDMRPVDDLDVENIRRIGVCLRRKIKCDGDGFRSGPFSLDGIPMLEKFFMPSTLDDKEHLESAAAFKDTFRRITTGSMGTFNLMSLTGDNVTEAPKLNPVCTEVIRKKAGMACFDSDVRHLVQAALTRRRDNRISEAIRRKCHAGFTEVFAPVFADGLIVGLVFGGQLVYGATDAERIMDYIKKFLKTGENSHSLEQAGIEEVLRTEQIVSGLAGLIGLLFEKYCIAENEAELREQLVSLGTNDPRKIYETVCSIVKRLLSDCECSVFRAEGNNLVLEATTAAALRVRRTPRASNFITTSAKEAIGKTFYQRGVGLTGGVLATGKSRFTPNAEKEADWAGTCGENSESQQVFLVPINREKCYGVIRITKAANLSEFSITKQRIIEALAGEVAILLHNLTLRRAEADDFREQARTLQTLFGEAAHEYKGPLHNILNISVAMQYTSDQNTLVDLHQRMKEEVYRAKRNTDNYLTCGIAGREEERYNIQLNDLGELVQQVASRFELIAGGKGLRIKIDASVRMLPDEIYFDKDRIDQVLSNIIENAVKYSFNNLENKDELHVKIKAKDKPTNVTVSITDMGLGIPQEAREQIFEGYQRVMEDNRVFKPGTGLGLMIARKHVRKHGGDIYVNCEPYLDDLKRLALNEGYLTTFTMSLPKCTSREIMRNSK